MNEQILRASVRRVEMSERMKCRVTRNLRAKLERRPAAVWRKPALAVLAAALCVTLALPALASVEPVYQLIYMVSPAVAQYFQPVRMADEDNGIRMEVVSAYIHGDTAEIYVTMQDLTGDRVDRTTDLFDSYRINRPFDSSAFCELVGYDSATGKATFLITIRQWGGKNVAGDKITFSVGRFLSHIRHYEGVEIPYDLSAAAEVTETWQPYVTGGNWKAGDMLYFNALIPGEPWEGFPVEGINLTGIGYADGKLHIQTSVVDNLNKGNHGYVYLIDPDGNQIDCIPVLGNWNASFATGMDTHDRVDYNEFVFDIAPEELAGCKLYGEFWTSGMLTEGNWRVTFPLEQADQN